MRKTTIAVIWLVAIGSPALLAMEVLELLYPEPTIFHADQYVCQLAGSPDGRTVASTDLKGIVTLFGRDNCQPRAILRGHRHYVRQMAFSPDSMLLATASDDDTIRLWDVATGYEQRLLAGHKKTVCCVLFAPNGKWLASGDEDGVIMLWDAATGENTVTFTNTSSNNYIRDLAIDPSGSILASTDKLCLKLWDIAAKKELITLSHSSWSKIAFSPDSKSVASIQNDRVSRLSLWDVTMGEERIFADPYTSNEPSYQTMNRLQFNENGSQLVCCCNDHNLHPCDSIDYVSSAKIEVWDVATAVKTVSLGRGTHQIFPPSTHLPFWLRNANTPDVQAVQFTSQGKLIALERNAEKIGLRQIDLGLGWAYRTVWTLAILLTIVVAQRALKSWMRIGLPWQFQYALFLTAFATVIFVGFYTATFWVAAWGDGTRPLDSELFGYELWLAIYAIPMVVLKLIRWLSGTFLKIALPKPDIA